MSLSIVILAAGKGTRMRSRMPKVLHSVGGTPMLGHVMQAARQLSPTDIAVVVGHGSDQIKECFAHEKLIWVEQVEQKGTGHAVQQAMPVISGQNVLVLFGDVPLIEVSALSVLVDSLRASEICLLTAHVSDPFGYGRVVRDSDGVAAIVEHKDATPEQRAICEVNTGMLAARYDTLTSLLAGLDNRNAQQEYLLTDIVAAAQTSGLRVDSVTIEREVSAAGVNDRVQLATLERVYQQQLAAQLMADGVTVADPCRIDIRGKLSVGSDSFIDINCVFHGDNAIGNNVTVGPNCVITNATIADNTVIEANCVIQNSVIGKNCTIGPFARMRPGTLMREQSKLGNFVETKNSDIGVGSKINHLAYVGDSDVSENVNIGAGVITANYDGANKYRTTLEPDVFVGSNSVLVAPITIGKGATVGAGSTVSRDVGENELVLTRAKLRTAENWQRPRKK